MFTDLSLSHSTGGSDALITVYTKYLMLEPNQLDSSQVTIDSSIGKETQFLFDYSQGEASVEAILSRPDGTTITKTNTMEYFEDSSFSLTRINIDGVATVSFLMLPDYRSTILEKKSTEH